MLDRWPGHTWRKDIIVVENNYLKYINLTNTSLLDLGVSSLLFTPNHLLSF